MNQVQSTEQPATFDGMFIRSEGAILNIFEVDYIDPDIECEQCMEESAHYHVGVVRQCHDCLQRALEASPQSGDEYFRVP